jgi:hypothetical protein
MAVDRYEKAAHNQSLFREVNERIEELAEQGPLESMDIMCECSALHCAETIQIEQDEYNAIREHPNRFPIRAGHESHDVERIVDRHASYIVVEKLNSGHAVAEARDPRD